MRISIRVPPFCLAELMREGPREMGAPRSSEPAGAYAVRGDLRAASRTPAPASAVPMPPAAPMPPLVQSKPRPDEITTVAGRVNGASFFGSPWMSPEPSP